MKQAKNPFYKKQPFHSILAFVLLQGAFVFMEVTGWIPRFRDIEGKLFGTITDSALFKEWFHFYETPFFNLITVFFGMIVIIDVIIAVVKLIIPKKTKII